MADLNIDWMTNFYYGQELRSLYMNGLLNSGFKPGVYNASMYLYTRSNDDQGAIPSGLYLHINKGTTLVFSNKYNLQKDRYERDIDTAGSYVIKSTAFSDIEIPLVTLSSAGDSSVANILNSTSDKKSNKFYIAATMAYNPDEDLSQNKPIIVIFEDNVGFEIPDEGNISEEDRNNFFFNITSSSNFRYKIPDGSNNYEGKDTTDLLNFGYLILGCVIDFTKENQIPGFDGTYVNSSGWANIILEGPLQGVTSSDLWIRNHVFTGRGFPDYRQNYIDTKSELYPDIIPESNLNEFCIDIPSLVSNNILYQSKTDFRQSYRYGYDQAKERYLFSVNDTLKNRKKCFKLDYKVYNEFLSSEDPSLKSNLDYEKEANDILKEINEKGLKFGKVQVGGGVQKEQVTVADFVFLSTRQSYSAEPSAKLYQINDIFVDYKEESKLNKSELLITPFRLLTSCNFNILDPLAPTNSSESSTITSILPLDIGEDNIERLKNLFYNRNVVPLIADYMRRNYNESPYLSPQESTELIPVVAMFRTFEVVRDSESGQATEIKPWFNEMITKAPYEDNNGKMKPGRVHPANILSFFDLQFKTNPVTCVNITQPYTYEVIPVMV